MAWAPPQNIGDRDPLIPAAKRYLARFSYGQYLGDSDEYTAEFGVALRQWQNNIHYQVAFKGRPGPDVNQLGVFDWAVKKQMGLLPITEPILPWIITVAGHLGPMDTGPAYLSARDLELRGLARVQMVGYDNSRLPFNNDSGFNELHRIVTQVLPQNVPWALASHSQGGIITSDYLEQVVIPGKSKGIAPFVNFRGGLHYANPRRPFGVVAPWVTDPPPANTEGLDPDCLDAKIDGVEEVSRNGDLYTVKRRDNAGEDKAAVYLAAARGRFFGKDSLAEQIGELVLNFGPEVWALFQAITGGIQFLINMDPHNVFDLRPGIGHLESILD
ncbi:hypothetical protein A5746_20960 [Mycolicibacterium conceptionense]|uniref:hypothetical protein n=1 Tax=Mycolicibacterium conceptionense TaxID=451644 RepID=UPI0007EC9F7D|nr:hypothetical protein [Mycolicibacterium conceptionense]OBK00051.1 hypothetical protein A5639_27605 [Mycolicibacterium conceptionense]OMB81458.1 hypothetical protein A5741_25225 [Mycolicibacterium conceptionense]OMB90772.1 hypothetical protein A5746_20960 [Mycolicibacterium conceptionense]